MNMKNPRTTVAALLVAVAAVLGSGLAVEFSPAAAKYFHLAAALFTAVGLVLAKDAAGAPPGPTPPAAGPYRAPLDATPPAVADEKPPTAATRGAVADGFAVVLVAGAALLAVLGWAGCLPAKTVAAIGADVEQIACIVMEAELGESEPAVVAALCAVPPSVVADVLGARAKGRAMAAARLSDAGVAK
jgi:hypothetical protein